MASIYQLIDIIASGLEDSTGTPLSNGYVYITAKGSSSPLTNQINAYADSEGNTLLYQPIHLSPNGSAKVYVNTNGCKIWVYNNKDVLVNTFDDVEIMRSTTGGIQIYAVTTTPYVITNMNALYSIETGIDVDIYLPLLSSVNIGDKIIIQKTGYNNNIVVRTNGNDKILGSSQYVMSSEKIYEKLEIIVLATSSGNKYYSYNLVGEAYNANTISGKTASAVPSPNVLVSTNDDTQYINTGFIPIFRDTISITNLFIDVSDSTDAVNISCSKAYLENANNDNVMVTNISKTLTLSNNGVNGLDTGSVSPNTWYALYLIYNPDTGATDTLASLNFSTPVMPSGYTHRRYIGFIRRGSTAIVKSRQVGDLWMPKERITVLNTTSATVNTWTVITTSLQDWVPYVNNAIYANGAVFTIGTRGTIYGMSTQPNGFGGEVIRSGVPASTSNIGGMFANTHYNFGDISLPLYDNVSLYYYSGDNYLEIIVSSLRVKYA